MRRIRLVLVTGVVMAAMLVAVQGPAMADVQRCHDFNDDVVRCDGEFFVDTDEFGFFPFFFDDDFDFGFDHDGVVQSIEQEVDSGDASQSFHVS